MTPILDPKTTPLAPLAGLHHVTAITADAAKNVAFYTRTLGLRLVKVTINYDDPSSYHLYYGDGLGRPGTLMTHFAWPMARRGATGPGHVVETAFTIPIGTADYWRERLTELSVSGVETVDRFGHHAVTFQDAAGMALAVIETPAADDKHLWRHGDVAPEFAIRGLHSVTLAEESETAPAGVLVDRFGYREIARAAKRIRYEAASDAVAKIVDVVIVPKSAPSRMGAGQVHHVAFRTPGDQEQGAWLRQLRADGHNVSTVMERDYFRSIYFREPGGVLFEIATGGPGMTINESAEELGTRVVLPAWLEPQRAEVEANLPVITLAKRIENFAEPAAALGVAR